jgi:hypothetical protein
MKIASNRRLQILERCLSIQNHLFIPFCELIPSSFLLRATRGATERLKAPTGKFMAKLRQVGAFFCASPKGVFRVQGITPITQLGGSPVQNCLEFVCYSKILDFKPGNLDNALKF